MTEVRFAKEGANVNAAWRQVPFPDGPHLLPHRPTRTIDTVRRLVHRPRRLRRSPGLRNLVRETTLHPHDFILPLFINETINKSKPVPSMPGVSQLSIDE